MLYKTILRTVLVTTAATVGAVPAVAQDYPSKEVRWVIPWNAGGSNDIMARYLQPLLEEQGVSVVIENLPGGTGAVGMGDVAVSQPDGYTIGNGTSSTLAIMAQGKAPLSNDDFTNVIRVSVDPLILVIPGSSEIDTLAQFLEYMKENPGDVTIGTPGTNNLNHIFAAMTAQGAGVDYRHVPFPGGSRVIAELMGNQIAAGVLKPSETIEQISNGDLKALGAFSDERLEVLPDVPTFAEEGVDVFPYGPVVQMAYIQAPAGLAPEVEETLADAFEAALTSDQFREFADKNGFVIDPIRGDALDEEVTGVSNAIAEVAQQVFTD
ncbi:Bug family tripartite tricarboxylate transporter substrate binding protein [Paracoccus aerodenitrificans]|uniref:Bug family tripartite tricarboxylate transporter substrate binding protein n=1 Tax=Paracoccus aerodenitrificans TaxID=3017781 RepID=UPI0022F10176|nr:tripartite tricarboxylate transporter substrate binding protein [Paracoccus aerodenitrificans]WBU64796.1 tripartite tricarboxylate transporter substrate binding protein [Paracoccus aerodenitrificans]